MAWSLQRSTLDIPQIPQLVTPTLICPYMQWKYAYNRIDLTDRALCHGGGIVTTIRQDSAGGFFLFLTGNNPRKPI